MTTSSTLVVFGKELTDGLRDRRSLISAFVYSLLGPLLLGFALTAVARQAVDHGTTAPAVAEAERAPSDPASAERRAAVALGMLPMFLLMAAFVASMNLAIDATAGERERGSLESLLVHPVPRSAVAAGKWLAAAVLGVAGIGLTLAASRLVLASGPLRALELPLALAFGEVVSLLAVLLPLALFAPAFQMLVALFCRSFKEAQTYLSLLLFVPILPGFFFSFGSREPAGWMEWLPLAGQQILAARVLRGGSLGLEAAGLAAVTVALGLACVAATGWLLGRERIVLGR